ncbi:MAG: hypothetical protein ABI706_05725 [Ilumatobacteraceae bacterium]
MEGRQPGFRHPAIVATAQRILHAELSVIHVVPSTTTVPTFQSEIVVEPDDVDMDHQGERELRCYRSSGGVSGWLD